MVFGGFRGYLFPPSRTAVICVARSVCQTSIAILAILSGSCGLIYELVMIAGIILLRAGVVQIAALDALMQDSTILSVEVVTLLVSMALSSLALVAGVGMLSLNPAGRSAIIAYSIAKIAVAILSMAVYVFVLFPREQQIADNNKSLASGIHKIDSNVSSPSQIFSPNMQRYASMVRSIIFAVAILRYMCREDIESAFEDNTGGNGW